MLMPTVTGVWMTDKRCPKCGSSLNTDGAHFWCSMVGCDFGLSKAGPVLVATWERAEWAARQILVECLRAMALHGPMHSAHEGYAVLLEEVNELWEQVKRRDRDPEAMRREAVQVGAMALRFVVDLCGGETT